MRQVTHDFHQLVFVFVLYSAHVERFSLLKCGIFPKNKTHCEEKHKKKRKKYKSFSIKITEEILQPSYNLSVHRNISFFESHVEKSIGWEEYFFLNLVLSKHFYNKTVTHSTFSTAVSLGEMFPFGPVQLK